MKRGHSRYHNTKHRQDLHTRREQAFTLIELAIVIALVGALFFLAAYRTGGLSRFEERTQITRLTDLIEFLHHQAVTDQAFYLLQFSLQENSYKVGVLRPEAALAEDLAYLASQAGNLTLELAAFLSPSLGDGQTLIPPPSFPSLAEPEQLAEGTVIEDIHTMRGKLTPETHELAHISFSPRGFSEFAVIHLRLPGDRPITILVNPFTGLTEVFRDYKEFEWTYGRQAVNE